MSVYHIQSLKDLDRLLTTYKDATLAINFYTEWSAQSKIISKEFECLSRNPVCDPLVFAHCHTEIHSDISQRYNVDKVPTLLFIKKGKVVDRLDGFEPKYLQKKLLHHGAKQYQCTYHLNVSPSDLCTRMNTLLNCTEMILFVKCFYSAISWEFYALLDSMCVPYEVFNVSYDMAVEEYLKNCWNITTYPQLFLFGYCVGNFEKVRKIKNDKKCFPHLKKAIDVINERHKCGVDLVAFASHRVEKMLEENDIVVFLEDDGAKPCSCDTRQVLDILNETDLPFITFNVQQDGHIRRKVREISNWESFPQVFSHGHFVGGVNMMTVLKNQNELVPLLKAECRLDNCGKKITTPVKLPNSDSDDYIV